MPGGLQRGVEGLADVLIAFGDELEDDVDQIVSKAVVFGDEFKQLLALDNDFGVVVGFVDQLQNLMRVYEN